MKSERTEENLDPFAEHLIHYDEAVAEGSTERRPEKRLDDIDAETAERFERAKQCLQMIERAKHFAPDSRDRLADELNVEEEAEDLEETPASIGRFRIVRELGRGGFGVVFLAIDPELEREVALKVPRPEVILSPDLKRRFLREGKAAASLNHAHIVPVFEVGHAGAIFYIASAYCDGQSLAEWLTDQKDSVSPHVAAELVRTLAEAVQHAHSRDVVHRDLKPSNVLLESVARGKWSVADQDRLRTTDHGLRAKITDFGLAKSPHADGDATHTGAVLGTPSYMAPEQARGDKHIGPVADIFALGAILYELLTGRPPFRKETNLATLRAVELEEPVRPGRLRKSIARDVESICLKCLANRPEQRYATATALADDLNRYLNGEPIRARRANLLERALLWARKRPAHAAAALMTVVAFLALGGFGMFWWNYSQSQKANALLDRFNRGLKEANSKLDASNKKVNATSGKLREANAKLEAFNKKLEKTSEQLRDANTTLKQFRYFNLIKLAGRALEDGRPDVAKPHLAACPPDLRHWEWHHLNRLAGVCKCTLAGHQDGIRHVAFTPNGRFLVSASFDGVIKLWDWPSGKEAFTLKNQGAKLSGAALSPDGSRLATAVWGRRHKIEVWDLINRRVLKTITGLDQIICTSFSPDGTELLAKGPAGLKIWDLQASKIRFQLPIRRGTPTCYSPDGKHLAYGYNDSVEIRDAQTSRKVRSWKAHLPQVSCIVYSPDGGSIATAGYDKTVKLWSVDTGRLRATLVDHKHVPISCLAFSPDSRRLVSASGYLGKRAEIRIWDLRLFRRPIASFSGDGRILSVAFSRDGKYVATGGLDGLIRIWDTAPRLDARKFSLAGPFVTFFPDGKRLATVNDLGCIRIHDVETRAILGTFETGILSATGITISRDGKYLAMGIGHRTQIPPAGTVVVWDVETLLKGQDTVPCFKPTLGRTRIVHAVSFSPDCKDLAVGADGSLILWNLVQAKGNPRARGRLLGRRGATVLGVVFSPDGRTAAASYKDSNVRIWNAKTGKLVHTLAGHVREVSAVAFSPNGKGLASGGADGSVRIWNTATGKQTMTLLGHRVGIKAVVFSPDGRRLFTSADDFSIRIWDLVTRQEILTLRAPARYLPSLAISPDGRRLACGTPNGVYVWDCLNFRCAAGR